MKQAIVSMIVVMIAAGILAGMVLYSVSVMRQVQLRILTGEFVPVADVAEGGASCDIRTDKGRLQNMQVAFAC